ncbi:nucleotidyltransferase domain-containing protein [Caldalkalibacillus mannanilyticus]|uniref:nucleotidyltransferase domain-containing protein n=1 Tax=Caldalkalibacillus mannanilyticus TaxID=1418 RepID=UPI00046875CF|nr:nucleotidyltransferase family protein [Caldalkalibacillus mannanilyticus]
MILDDVERSSIHSQVYHLLKERGLLQQTPLFFQQELKKKCQEALFQSIYIKSQTEHILKVFEQEEIEVIPLKGVTFAEKYFGHLSARGTSDIDLLVHSQDMERASACIRELGYTIEEELKPLHFHQCFSKFLPGSPLPLTIELHWNLLKEGTSDLNIHSFWEQAEPYKEYSYVKTLSDYHTFYLIYLHGWRSKMISLKYFLDIMQLIDVLGDRLDYTKLVEETKQHKTYTRLARTLSIQYSLFPFLHEVKPLPFEQKSTLWWHEDTIKKANAKVFTSYFHSLLYDFGDFDTLKHRFTGLYLIFLRANRFLRKKIE